MTSFYKKTEKVKNRIGVFVWKVTKKLRRRLEQMRGQSNVADLSLRSRMTLLSSRQFCNALRGYQSEESLLRYLESRNSPKFFIDGLSKARICDIITQKYPSAIVNTIAAADKICKHLFDILGSSEKYLGAKIDWHQDFKVGKRWELKYHTEIDYMNLNEPSDIKVPWELNRCHHFITLGQAYWYTDDEKYAQEFVDQFVDWIESNPVGFGINWACPMEVALRAVNWIWAYYFFADSLSFTDGIKIRFFKALLLHGRHIFNNLEYEVVNGNHYLANGTGLVFLGVLFPFFKAAKRWLTKGLEIILGEIEQQVYSDGVNFEGSISYHRLALELLLVPILLCLKNSIEVPNQVLERLERMFDFTLHYTKPDGSCPLIGDADDGRLQILSRQKGNEHRSYLSIGAVLFDRADFKRASGKFSEEAFWLLGEEGLRKYEQIEYTAKWQLSSKAFPVGGFYIMRHNELYLIIDCGDVGMQGRGAHGHNDTLSFELYAYDKTFITDSGTYVYTASPEWRNRFRSSAAHNLVVVDDEEIARLGQEGMELWEISNDARPKVHAFQVDKEYDYFDGRHSGYQRLSLPVMHRRHIYFNKTDGYWIIKDILTGVGKHKFELYFHFSPAPLLVADDGLTVRTGCSGANLAIVPLHINGLSVEVLEGWVSYNYGTKVAAPVVKYTKIAEVPVEFVNLLYPTPAGVNLVPKREQFSSAFHRFVDISTEIEKT